MPITMLFVKEITSVFVFIFVHCFVRFVTPFTSQCFVIFVSYRKDLMCSSATLIFKNQPAERSFKLEAVYNRNYSTGESNAW